MKHYGFYASRQAASLLWNAWQGGQLLDGLPQACRPPSIADGYVIQRQLADLSGQKTAGWKIAASSRAGQVHTAVDGPFAGRLLEHKVLRHPATVTLGAMQMRVLEMEFAFVLARDLPPRAQPYTVEEVMERVGALHPAVEFPDSRYTDFTRVGAAQLIADDGCAYLFVLGEEVSAPWQESDLAAHEVALHVNGALVCTGVGADALGDPRIALTWLANDHAARGEGLAAGQIITTGVCGPTYTIAAGDRCIADFGAFGQVEVELVA